MELLQRRKKDRNAVLARSTNRMRQILCCASAFIQLTLASCRVERGPLSISGGPDPACLPLSSTVFCRGNRDATWMRVVGGGANDEFITGVAPFGTSGGMRIEYDAGKGKFRIYIVPFPDDILSSNFSSNTLSSASHVVRIERWDGEFRCWRPVWHHKHQSTQPSK